ncbi:hypothetical protein P7K49_019996 [Saguinus oedipus]|uniref:Uncharacterized protein n=1 Tax=Saguinus oedipus TaxID=9490 RepID=A0ABQ9UYY2_SAGOE|nr:hypothetical protein P7K49_019996 [Saguinus oedipus]
MAARFDPCASPYVCSLSPPPQPCLCRSAELEGCSPSPASPSQGFLSCPPSSQPRTQRVLPGLHPSIRFQGWYPGSWVANGEPHLTPNCALCVGACHYRQGVLTSVKSLAASTSRQEQQHSRKGRVQVAVTEAEEELFVEKQLLA